MPWFQQNAPSGTNPDYQYEMPDGNSVPWIPFTNPTQTGGGFRPASTMANAGPGIGEWIANERNMGRNPSLPNSIPGSSQGSGGNPQQAIQAILAKYPPGSAGLQQAMPEIQAAFPGTRFDTSGGPVDEIVVPGYGLVDVLANAETGGKKSWTWQTGGGGAQQAIGQVAGTLGGILGGGADYGARLPALEKTPGYQFRFDQGMKALQGSAAAKGTLNTGGFAKDAIQFGQGAASQEFDNEYRRLFGLAGLGQGAQGAIGQYGSSYAGNSTDLITGAGNAQAAGTVGSGNAWNSALGGVGQTALDAYMYHQMLKPQTPQAANPYAGWG